MSIGPMPSFSFMTPVNSGPSTAPSHLTDESDAFDVAAEDGNAGPLSLPTARNVPSGISMSNTNALRLAVLRAVTTASPTNEQITEIDRCMTSSNARDMAAATDEYGDTALHLAAQYGGPVLGRLLKHPLIVTMVDSRNNRDKTPLHLAASNNSSEEIDALLVHRATLDARDYDGNNAAMIAAKSGCDKALHALSKVGAIKLDAKNNEGMNVLHLAVQHQQKAVVTALLKAKPDLEQMDKHGDTALTLAAASGRAALVTQLLNAGAEVNHQNEKGETALHIAAHHGDATAVAALLEAKPNLELTNKSGDSVLSAVDGSDSASIISRLVEAGVQVNHQNIYGRTALHTAVSRGKGGDAMVGALLRANAALDLTNRAGDTPLTIAASHRGTVQAVSALVDAGAQFHCKNKKGETALDIAALGHFSVSPEKVAALLKSEAFVRKMIDAGLTLSNRVVRQFVDPVESTRLTPELWQLLESREIVRQIRRDAEARFGLAVDFDNLG